MSATRYTVRIAHTSEYPDPITFRQGELLMVGDRYQGSQAWNDWFFCRTETHDGGWVPLQIIEPIDAATARAREDYSARELTVAEGERLTALKTLNGWAWCAREGTRDIGWVPLENLTAID